MKRKAVLTAAAAAVFVTLVVALVAVSDQARKARQEAEKAAAVKDFLVNMIGRADRYSDGESPTLAAALKQAAPTVSERFEGQPELQAEVRFALGYALEGLGEFELARQQVEEALEFLQNQDDPVATARSINVLAGVAWGEGDYEKSAALYREALEILEGNESPEAMQARFDVLVDFGGLLPKMDRYREGLQFCGLALAIAEGLPEIPLRTRAVIWNNTAAAYVGLQQYNQSAEAYEISIELHRQAGSPHPDLAIALGNLGLTYELIDRMDEAVENVAAAVDMQRELLGEDHPTTVLYLYNLGSLQINAEDLTGARDNLAEAARLAEGAYSENHLYTGRINHRLAAVCMMTGDSEMARMHSYVAGEIYASRDDVPERWITDLAELDSQIAPTTQSEEQLGSE